MATLEEIRSAGEAELQALMAKLDARARKTLRQAIQRYGRVQDVPQGVWDEIKADTERETVTALYFLMIAADDWTTGEIVDQGGRKVRLSTDRTAGYSIDAANRARRMADLTVDTIRDRLARKVEDMKLDTSRGTGVGEFDVGDVDRALDDVLTPERRDGIAANETTGSISKGQMGAGERANQPGESVTVLLQWKTEGDERVCFQAGTMVETSTGIRPIDSLHEGDLVKTRYGYRPIISTMRRKYEAFGALTTVRAGDIAVTATADHPFWTLEQEWVAANNLKPGLTLYGVDNEPRKVTGVVNFRVCDANDSPAAALQMLGFPRVAGGVSMPVHAVNFQGNHQVQNGEVDGVSPHAMLRGRGNADGRKGDANGGFWSSLASRFPIARNAAILANSVARAVSNRLPARLALDDMGRAAAGFGAIVPPVSPVATKRLTASLASADGGSGDTAGLAASFIAMCDGCLNREILSARFAVLFDELGRCQAASTRATLVATDASTTCRKVERYVANRAHAVYAKALTLGRRMLHFLERKRHAVLYTKWTYVYDIQVAEYPEFFANGLLVHNCPRCSPLDGTFEDVWGEVFPDGPGEEAHPRCRCSLSVVVKPNADAIAESYREGEDKWITLDGGQHVKVEDGQSVADAIAELDGGKEKDAPREERPADTGKRLRFSAGAKLTPAQKKEVLDSMGDVYRDAGLKMDRVVSVTKNDEPIYGYPIAPEHFIKSDVTGSLIRHYVVMPDGTKAHPTEVFGHGITADVNKRIKAAEDEASAAVHREMATKRNKLARSAADKMAANRLYAQTKRPLDGSYFASHEDGRVVRVDASDPEDARHYGELGFKKVES